MQIEKGACRRIVVERRQANLRSFFHAMYRTRRREVRRASVTAVSPTYYMDWYEARSWSVVLMIMLLCIADAFLTVILINNGAKELNPIVISLLNGGFMWFFVLKYLLTATSAMIIMMHKRFLIFGLRGYHVLLLCAAGYLFLFHYQIALISQFF